MDLDGHVEILKKYESVLGAQNLSYATICAYSCDAKQYLNYFDSMQQTITNPNTFGDLDHYKSTLSGEIGENSLRRKIISLKKFISFVLDERYQINFRPSSLIPTRLESERYSFNEDYFSRWISSLSKQECHLKKSRDIAILNLIAIEGLKATEIIELEITDISLKRGQCMYLTIKGKRSRSFFVSDSTRSAVSNYIIALKQSKNIPFEQERLFVGMKGRKLGKILPSMTRHGVKFLINEMAKNINQDLSSEKLRQHAIWYQISQGKDLQELMKHFGLRQPGIIMKYLNSKEMNVDEK